MNNQDLINDVFFLQNNITFTKNYIFSTYERFSSQLRVLSKVT